MRFDEEILVPASVDEAWDFLWQFERLAACLPGCTSVQEIDPQKKYAARFEDSIGKYTVGFDMDILVEEQCPQSFVRLLCTGQDKRLRTSQRVVLEVELRPDDTSGTCLKAVADVTILGLLATLGQFVVKRKAKEIVQQFAKNIETELARQPPEASHA
jgi:carbon monoxide dehydrogenase subunit G